MLAEKAVPKQRGKPFKPGQSGNPNGKPKGVRNQSTLMLEKLLDDEGEEICRTVIKAAKGGNLNAAKLVLDRLVPPKKPGERTVRLDLPQINSPADAVTAMAHIATAVANGIVTPAEGEALAKIVETYIHTVEVCSLEQRLAQLEAQQEHGHAPQQY